MAMPANSTSKPACEHVYLRQTILSPALPPLYIAPPDRSPSTTVAGASLSAPPPISPVLVAQLERVHGRLGPTRFRSPCRARDIRALREELEGGMTRERREQVEIYVAGLRDPWKRACAELYLARYPGFVMGGDGRLDYGTREEEGGLKGDEGRRGWTWSRLGGCGVM
ncbi:unnamed protein product [Sphagnum jensenii]